MSGGDESPLIPHVIGGREVLAVAGQSCIAVTDPSTGAVIGHIPDGTSADVDAAVVAAAGAQPAWGARPLNERVQVIYRMKAILEREAGRLAEVIRRDNGKTLDEAAGEILRGVECCEYAASLPQISAGGVLEVGKGIECRLMRVPLGVVAAVTPFNFPVMVPLWMAPTAIAMGNALVLKPSEQAPLAAVELARLWTEAGLSDGIFNVVQGGRAVVEALCDHPGISALGFVGSTNAARAVYGRGTAAGKRVKALGGAKNHLVVVPDADPDMTVANVVASATGCAGQRCMAASVLLAVGDVEPILDRIKARFAAMRAGHDIGPLISAESRDRIAGFIDRAAGQGATVAVDGRKAIAEGVDPAGFWMGPTVFDHAAPSHDVSCHELFGPTLTIIRCATLDDALAIENADPHGNAAAIYTADGAVAKYFAERASAGMVGINIGVPVPREPFPFGGWNESSFGEGDLTGEGSYTFWSKTKKITTKWTHDPRGNWMS